MTSSTHRSSRHSAPETESVTQSILRDASRLWMRQAAHAADLYLCETGWKIHYAVDTDVIATYMAPEKNWRGSVVFEESRDDIAALVARITTEYVMEDLVNPGQAGKGSLLVITPHDEELERMLAAVQEKAQLHMKEAPDQFDRIVAAVHDHASDDRIIELLTDRAGAVMQLAEGHAGPLLELERFAKLPRGRLLNTLRYHEGSDATGFSFPRPPLSSAQPGFEAYAKLYGEWRAALERGQGSGSPKSTHALRRDARVLSTLEWVNRTLEAHRRRLVLITGSPSLFLAADQRAGGPDEADPLEHQVSFATLYLRHPISFLNAPELFLREHQEEGLQLGRWLGLLFPGSTHGADEVSNQESIEIHSKLSDSLLQAFDSGRPQILPDGVSARQIVRQWSDQIRLLAVQRGVGLAVEDPASRMAELVDKVRERARAGWTAREFMGHVQERFVRARGKLYSDTSFLGFLQLREVTTRVRGVPALRFDPDYDKAQQVCDEMQEKMFEGNLRLDLGRLFTELRGVDPEDYHALLIQAFGHAIGGRWAQALALCESAIEVVDALPEELRRGRRGREAAYFRAVAERRLAGDEEALERAQHWLDEALRREHPGDPVDIRFRSERLAQAGSRLYRAAFSTEGVQPGAARAPELLIELLPETERILEEVRSEPRPQIRAWVTRQQCVNIVGLALAAECAAPGLGKPFAATVLAMMRRLQDSRLAPRRDGKRFPDILSDAVFHCASAVFEPQAATRRTALRGVRQVAPEQFGSDQPRVAAYKSMVLDRPEPRG